MDNSATCGTTSCCYIETFHLALKDEYRISAYLVPAAIKRLLFSCYVGGSSPNSLDDREIFHSCAMPLPASPGHSTLEWVPHDHSAGAPERDHAVVAPEIARELNAPEVRVISSLILRIYLNEQYRRRP